MSDEFRKAQFVSTKTGKIVFKIEARVGKHGWTNLCHYNGKPMLFDDEAKRDAEFADLTR